MPFANPTTLSRLFLPLLLVVCLFGCEQEPETPDDPNPPIETEGLTYLALGDSYTIGESVPAGERWPAQLVDSLLRDGVDVDTFKIIARTGWTTDELADAIEAEAPIGTYDFVSLLIGVNNQFRGYPFAQYETEFVALLDSAVKFAGGNQDKVFVVSIPDYGVTPFGQTRDADKVARELDQYNAYADSICGTRNIPFFNITPISRDAISNSDLVAPDNLHPSGEMYRRWVSLMLDGVKELVE